MSPITPAPIRLLVNPTAGGGRAGRRARLVIQALEGHGLRVRNEPAGDRDHVTELAGAAANAGETVVTLGGDGIAGAAADGLREVPGSVLGIVPSGRGNDLARVLGVPSDPRAACAIVARGVARPMDLGEVDGRAFVGIASVGFDSDANRVANHAPAWLGSGVYAYGALRALLRWRPATFQLELHFRAPATEEPFSRPPGASIGGPERVQFAGYSVAFANSRCFGGGMRLAPAALLDDGVLDVVRIEEMTRARYAWHLPKVFRGTHLRVRSVHTHRVSESVISADRPFTMYADGDPIGELPVRVRVLPGAIHMLTPAICPDAFATSSRGRRLPTRLLEDTPGAAVSELSGGSPGSPLLA